MKTGIMVGLSLLATTASAQLTAQLDAVLAANTKPNQPGIALTVELDSKVVYEKSVGLADLQTKQPITSATNFRMASVSKQFTAMAILLLEKDGKLSLNDPLTRFFPQFNQHVGDKVRLHHLLTHSSGIMDYEAIMDPNQQEQLLDADIVTLLANKDSLYFEPGTTFRYSNSGFCLLALVVERATGQSFDSFIQQRIFTPLGMAQSRVYVPKKAIPNRAMGYARKSSGDIYFSDQSVTSATKGDGGVYTSLNDYRKWSLALRNNTLLDLKSALSKVKQPILGQSENFYSNGWFFTQPTNPVLFHSGSTCGFSTFVIHVPAQRFQVTFFSNIADQDQAFIDILNVLKNAGIPFVSDVMTLHKLTR